MSAAEKLKGLKAEINENSVGYDVLILRDALPEIIAVVQWAEKFSNYNDYHGWTNDEHPRLEPDLDAALSALDEALPQIGSATEPEAPTPQ